MNMQTQAVEGYVTAKVAISGKTLLMHNGQTSDPLNEFAQRMKVLSGKRSKTDQDHMDLAKLEYQAGLYLNTKDEVIVPSRVLEAVICEGARKTKEGKLALSGLFVDTDLVLDYAGGPLTVEELIDSPDHVLRVGVRVGQSKVQRCRPMFHDWSGTFECSVNAQVATAQQLQTWLKNAGFFVGVGDWRPRHGRFTVDGFDVS